MVRLVTTDFGTTRAHHTHRFSPPPTAPDASVGNASPSPGPFSQALARALVPHLSDTSGTMCHPRNYRRRRRRRWFYESLETRRLFVFIKASPLITRRMKLSQNII